MVPVVARAAAVGVAGFFMETHPNPEIALSDGPNTIPIDKMGEMLKALQDIDNITK